jgi:iron(III) transport system permease protein
LNSPSPYRAAASTAAAPRDHAPPTVLLLLAILVSALVLAPIAVTVFDAVRGSVVGTLALLFRPVIGHLLLNTIGLAVVCAVGSGLVSLAMAWLIERSDVPGYSIWRVLAPLPLALPAFVSSYAWLSISPSFQGAAGAALVVSASYYPLVYLPLAAALRGLDPAQEESARSLGLSPLAAFCRVTLPQLRPALLGGTLLLVLHVLTEFGAFALLRFRTFTTAIYSAYNAGLQVKQGALLACVLLFLCFLCLWGEQRLRGQHDYASIGAGVRRMPRRHSLGWGRIPALIFLGTVFTAAVGVPLATIGYWLTRTDAAAMTTTAVSTAQIIRVSFSSIGYGVAAGILTTALAFPVAYLAARYHNRAVQLIERTTYLPKGVPGIVVALALVTLSLQLLYPLYQTAILLVLAYAIIFMPLAVVSIRATAGQIEPGLENSARALGVGRFGVFRRVTLPLTAPGLGSATALVFISVCTELPTTLLLIPTGAHTLATEIWAESSNFAFAAAAPYAAVLAAISMLAAWLLANRFGRAAVA